MPENHVILLGIKGGPAIRPGSSMPTSNLIVLNDQQIVVDCGLGVTKALVDQGVELKKLSMIFITHLHSDHCLELGPLLHTAWTAGLNRSVTLYGPVGLEVYWHGFIASMQADIDLRIADEGRSDLRDLISIHPIDAGTVYAHDGLVVSAIRTHHPPLIDTFALSFKTAKTHVVFSGDTAPLPALIDFARNADLLIHEAMLEPALPALMARVGNGSEKLLQHMFASHCPAQDAAKTATRAGVKRLALTHLIPADDPSYTAQDWVNAVAEHWGGPLFVGYDGCKITL